jgi:DNA-binding MarR family transcriptional regulator
MKALVKQVKSDVVEKVSRGGKKSGRRRAADIPVDLDFRADSLGYSLKRAQMRSYDMFFEMLGPQTVSPARMTALSIIATEQRINQSTLAERLGISRPSVVKVVDALESLGMIERLAIPDDRRSYALVLTRPGVDELRAMRDKVTRFEAALVARLSIAERAQLMDLLSRVAVP